MENFGICEIWEKYRYNIHPMTDDCDGANSMPTFRSISERDSGILLAYEHGILILLVYNLCSHCQNITPIYVDT